MILYIYSFHLGKLREFWVLHFRSQLVVTGSGGKIMLAMFKRLRG